MKEFNFKINGNEYEVLVDTVETEYAKVTVNGAEYTVEFIQEQKDAPLVKPVAAKTVATPAPAPAAAPVTAPKPAAGGDYVVKSPLPGVILDLCVKVGDTVAVGQRLVVLEAMKMENNVDSDKAGVVKSLAVGKGDSVLEGDALLTIG